MRTVPEDVLDSLSLPAFAAQIRFYLPRRMSSVGCPQVAANDALEDPVCKWVVPEGSLVFVVFFWPVLEVACCCFQVSMSGDAYHVLAVPWFAFMTVGCSTLEVVEDSITNGLLNGVVEICLGRLCHCDCVP